MIKKGKLLIASGIYGTASVAVAHPGHDHAHWLSEPIHVLSALAIGATVLTAGFVLKKTTAKKSVKIKSKK